MTESMLSIPLHRVTFKVPVQRFRTVFSVTQESRLSVVDEFALRLIAVCGRVTAGDFLGFFGYNQREGVEVLNNLLAWDFVTESDGQVTLTASGESLFPQGSSDHPRMVELDERDEILRMDLLDFRLIGDGARCVSLGVCARLETSEPLQTSNYGDVVSAALDRQFNDYALRKKLDPGARLYAVSSVSARTRYEHPVDVDLNLVLGRTATVDHSFDADPDDVPRFAGALREWLSQPVHSDEQADDWSYVRDLFHLALPSPPEPDDLVTFRDTRNSADLLAVVGSLSVDSVLDRVTEFIADTVNQSEGDAPEELYWLPCDSRFWFRSRSSWSALDSLYEAMTQTQEPTSCLVLRTNRNQSKLHPLTKRFSDVRVTGCRLPPGVEVLLSEGAWCVVLAWLPMTGDAIPVPVGFVTSRKSILDQVILDLNLSASGDSAVSRG